MEFEYNKADIKSLLKNFTIANVEKVDSFFVTNVVEKKKKSLNKNLFMKREVMGFLKIKQKMKRFLKNLKILEIL